jgi:hypothetical protein
MTNLKYITLILIAVFFSSCEKVIDVDLDTAPPKLVIDAAIKWTKGTIGNEQKIKLSTTTDYFSNTIPAVSGATVFITDAANNVFNFTETAGTGVYLCSNFAPVLNGNYVLTVVHNGETYTASETLKPVPAIDFIDQKNDGGFTGEDIEIKAFFTDNGATDDFYLFRFKASFSAIPNYGVAEDKFFQGNQIFGLYTHEDLETGQNIDISIAGISQRYYNYMNILTSIAGSNGGSPFQSPPATVRGNIVNVANEANFALGYFSLSEVDFRNYQVE